MASRGQKQTSLDMCMTALVGYFMRLDHVYWRKTDALKRTGFKYRELSVYDKNEWAVLNLREQEI